MNETWTYRNFTLKMLKYKKKVGENYEKLGSYISQGAQIRFEITSCSNSNTFNNSSIQYVNADFLGTNITVLDFVVGEDGQLYFKTEAGKDYMYRVVDVSGAEYLGWQQITADAESYVIDLTQIETLTSANTFRVQVITTGNAETSGIIYNDDAIKLVIDSAMVASEDAFMLSPTAHEVKPHYTDLSKVCVSLEDQNSVIYASLSSNYDFDNVIKLDIDYANILEDNGYYLYQMDYTGIFDMFGITETTNIYFFVKKSGEEANYVISKPFEYEFKIDNSTSFISIEKNVVSDEEDYVNTYLTYEKQDGEDMDKVLNNFDIQGFYIKIVHTSLEGEVTTIKAIYNKINLVEDIFEDKIALNITYLLSEDCLDVDENPVDQGAGSYKIYISNIKVVNEGTEDEPVYITYFSPYVETTTGGEEFVFEKLPEMSSVYLNNGDLYWTYDAEMMGKVTKYYIYYISTSNYKDYNIYKTQNNTQNSYSGLLFAGDSNAYNISVQPVSSDPKIIAGNEKYVADSDGTPINVVKNRFNNTLHLSTNGTLSVNWNANVEDSTTDHDIYKLLKQENITAEMANDFIHETIYYPFTFNVSELVYGSTKVRFRFTSYRTDDKSEIAFRRSVDVDAIYLLGNIINEGFTLEEFEGKLDEISNLLVNTADKNIVRDFKSVIKARMGGIGNYINIFDDFFEIVQEGKYEIEYCLLGNSSTLNSVWYQLTQDDGSKDFYINPTPSVVADRSDEPVDGISYEYFIKVRQSNIYLKDGSKEPAKTYFIQMKTNNETKKYGFEISTQDSGNTWSLKMVGNDNVASYNIDQEVVSENEKYLIIYFNLHDGCSIKAQYNDYVKNEDFALELFAQGNAVSLSSKSSRFTVSFYNACDSFKIEDGKFSWISHLNNPTNILYKFKDDNKEQPATAVAEQNRMSYFSLEGKPTGLYEYIKFVTEGRVEGNTIRIDSEVYTINNVYKLNSPSLNTSLNLISVDDTANDKFYTDKAYSDNEFHRFKVYNDISTENSSYIFPSGEAVGYYQPGITNYLSTDVDYAYKATEESASKFYFTSLGSTATFSTILDSSDASHNNYTFKIAGHEDEDLSVCVMSSVKEFNAKMLKPVSDILVGNGIITWNNFNVLGEETYDEENYSMVYKVTMSFYERNNSSAGTTEDIVGTPIECYTTKTMFDTSKVEDKFPQGSYSFLKVTIQAMILSLVENPTSENYVELVEGGYAQGQNITYTSISNNILISNGEEINDIQFSKPVTNIKVISDEGDTYGKISWEYSGNANFIVEDENGKEVSGSIANNSNTYIFTPNANELEGGEHKLTVYATSLDGGNVVKSNGVDITIYKLQNFGQNTDGDYEIFEDTKELSNGESMSVEIIDFSKYFDSIPENINATVNVSYQVEEESHNVILTKDNSTIIILTEALAENVTFKENESYIVIESSLDLTIKVTGKYADSTLFNILNADEYILHLERPKNNYVISWDTIKQIFTWQLEEGAEKQDEDAIVFVVTVNYLQGGMDGTIRRYEMTEKEFMPTIIHDSIKMELAVKFGEQGLMSSAVAYNGEQGDAVSFNLFTSGDGTSENPYVIDDENEFKNMQYRMTKPAYLNSYIEYQNGEPTQKTELERFYFEIKSKSNLNIQFEEEQGILFKGTFDGILRGNDSTINFTTKSVEKLTSNVVIKDGVVKSLESGQSTTTFSYGISLFENIGANSSISNLTITPNFTANEVITTHALISGLAINNRGTITNVSIGGMTSNLVVFKSTESLIGAYSGIVSVNSGTISSCSINGDIILSDTSSVSGEEKVYAENFFVGGICYTNYREIRNCVLRANISLSIGSNMMTTHQLAGFAVTSTETGTLSNNQIEANAGETYKVQITCLTTNQCRAYVAGIAVYGKGSINNNVSNEGCAVANNVTEPYIANDIVEGI